MTKPAAEGAAHLQAIRKRFATAERYLDDNDGLLSFGEARVLLAEVDRLTPFYEAIIDAHVVNFTLQKEHHTNALKALADLIQWEVKCSHDPAISKEAAELQAKLAASDAARATLRQQLLHLMREVGNTASIEQRLPVPRQFVEGEHQQMIRTLERWRQSLGALADLVGAERHD